ncbi:MAG: DUF433 domain-containing protein [Planctomycetales bacterium]
MTVMHGVVHGRTIQLDREPGLPDGQTVRVEIEPLFSSPAWWERIVVDPAVAPGKRTVKGTGLAADDLAELVEQGRSDGELLKRHPELSPADVAAVREYARVPAGLRRAAGSWADDPQGVDEFVNWNREQRKLVGGRIP